MSARSMVRLATLYARVERMHEAELARAAAAVRSTANLQVQRQAERSREAEAGAEALHTGDMAGWVASQASRQGSLHALGLLADVRRQEEATRSAAQQRHRDSRIEREQVERLNAQGQQQRRWQAERTAQRDADDRFLAQGQRNRMARRSMEEQP